MFRRRPRLSSFDYVGPYRYFLTFCAYDRRHYFDDAATVDLAKSQIVRASIEHGFDIPTYCFMPDHLHLLVEGNSEPSDLKAFGAKAKQLSAYAVKHATGKRLWQPSFYDHVLRDEDDTWGVAFYIIANPVRAGLVKSPGDYPFLGSCTVSLRELLDFAQHAPEWTSDRRRRQGQG